MQGTVVMLMALTGMGCHHKACDTGYHTTALTGCYGDYMNACYASYAPACYAEPVVMSSQVYMDDCCGTTVHSACYSDMYNACYSVPALYKYGKHRHRHGGLFGCFKRKRCGACNPVYSGWDSCYGAAVFGSYPPATFGDVVYSSPMTSGQTYGRGAAVYSTTPDSVPPPSVEEAAPTTVPAEGAPTPPTPAPSTPPPPPAGEGAIPPPPAVEDVTPPSLPTPPAPNF